MTCIIHIQTAITFFRRFTKKVKMKADGKKTENVPGARSRLLNDHDLTITLTS